MRPDLLDAADRHDPSPAAATHRRDQFLQQLHRAPQIDRDLPVEPPAIDRLEGFRHFDRGVQNQDVDRRPGRHGFGQPTPRIVEREVLRESARGSAIQFELADDGPGIRFLLGSTGVMNRDLRTGTAQRQRDGPADFRRAPVTRAVRPLRRKRSSGSWDMSAQRWTLPTGARCTPTVTPTVTPTGGSPAIFSISHHEHRSGIEPLTGSARSVPIAPFRFAARG